MRDLGQKFDASGADTTLVPYAHRLSADSEFFQLYKETLYPHIDLVYGWDETHQRTRFERAYAACDVHLIRIRTDSAGYVATQVHEDTIHLSLLIVQPSYQRMGVGRAVVTELMATAECVRKEITLSCFGSNRAAMSLYELLGFQQASIDEHFVNYRWTPSTTAPF